MSIAKPVSIRNPSETRPMRERIQNSIYGSVAGVFFPTPQVCLRTDFRRTCTCIHRCYPCCIGRRERDSSLVESFDTPLERKLSALRLPYVVDTD